MSEEDHFYSNSGNPDELIQRFEEMLKNDDRYFFDADQFEEIIDYYLERNTFSKAINAIEHAVEIFPDNPGIMLREAQMMASTGKISQAVPKLKTLLKFEANNEDALVTLATIYSQMRKHKEAIVYFREAINNSQSNFKDEIYIDLAIEYESLDQWNKAIEVLKEALTFNSENETALYELVYCYEETEQSESCLKFLNDFLDNHPYSFPAWYNLGNVYQSIGLSEKAIESYDFSIAINDKFGPAYLNKALSYVKENELHKAIKTYNEVLEFEPPQATLYCYMGECYERLEENDKAREHYQLALDLDPILADAHVGMGMVNDMENQVEAALNCMKKAIDLEPEQADYYLLYGTMLKRNQRFEEAKKIFERAITLTNKNLDIWIEYADTHYKTGNVEQSIEVIEEGLKHNHFSSELSYKKAAFLILSGYKQEGLQLLGLMLATDFEKSESLFTDFPELENDPDIVLLYNDFKS